MSTSFTPVRYGHQIAAVRMDDLDRNALAHVTTVTYVLRPAVIDLGCGVGAMSVTLATCGARVVAIDIEDFESEVARRRAAAGLPIEAVTFVHGTAQDCLQNLEAKGPWDVIYSQRMLHYLTYAELREVLSSLYRQSHNGGRLFLGVSGLASELGNGYPAGNTPVQTRFSPLAPEQQLRHHIYEPVCLYSPDELRSLVTDRGFFVTRVWRSEFGNVKLEAIVGG